MAGLVPFNRRRLGIRPREFEEFYNMLDDFFTEPWLPYKSGTYSNFRVDVKENKDEYVVDAELPGVLKEEIELKLNDGNLTIIVKREEKIDEEQKNYIHKERRYCSMQRVIYLEDAMSENIKAKLENGVLNIHVPKKEGKAESHKINID